MISISVCLCSLVLLAPGQTLAEGRFFPLDPGTVWTYQQQGNAANTREVTVLSRDADSVVVDFFGTEARLEDRTSEVDLDLGELGVLPYYRFAEEQWTHRDFHSCDDDVLMTVSPTREDVTTPLGVYEKCLKIEYGPAKCADAGTGVEWWAEGVGRVKWVEQSFIGERTYVLAGLVTGDEPTFRRADANSDGSVNLSDAVFTLDYLFGGGNGPLCPDALDSNDDGIVNISDPIAALGFLFLGDPAPPAPGPADCGSDPTADQLPACGQQPDCP